MIGGEHGQGMTLGEAILDARSRREAANHDLRSLIEQARRDGVTLKRLGKLLGWAPSTVMRFAPLEDDIDPGAGDPLDSPAPNLNGESSRG